MNMEISIPANESALGYLKRRNPQALVLAGAESSPNPYYNLGSHPDIVERIWDRLGMDLPEDCRWIVCGTPALVQPATGILFAFGLGTQYVLRLPGGLAEEAVRLGLKTVTQWAGGRTTDLRRELGEDWVFGGFLDDETGWLQKAYDTYTTIP
jgi:hypothetical protein